MFFFFSRPPAEVLLVIGGMRILAFLRSRIILDPPTSLRSFFFLSFHLPFVSFCLPGTLHLLALGPFPPLLPHASELRSCDPCFLFPGRIRWVVPPPRPLVPFPRSIHDAPISFYPLFFVESFYCLHALSQLSGQGVSLPFFFFDRACSPCFFLFASLDFAF